MEPVGLENPPPLAILLQEAGDLLADEPPSVLAILLRFLNKTAGDDSAAPRLLLLLVLTNLGAAR